MAKLTAAEKREILHAELDDLLAGVDVKELFKYATARRGVSAPSVAQAMNQLSFCHSGLTAKYGDVLETALAGVTAEAITAFRARNPRAKNACVVSFANGNVTHNVVLQRLDTPDPTVWWIENEKLKGGYIPLDAAEDAAWREDAAEAKAA